MAPRESQFEKFNNTIAKISDSIDSGKVSSTEIYEEIKNQLRESLSTVYEEWENSQFDPSFKFKLSGGLYDITETTLLHSAIDCREKESAYIPPEAAFYMVGNIDEAMQKAELIKAETKVGAKN